MQTANNKTLIMVVGPTAVGKTAMAIRLANYFDTEIISADSRQFYREMSVGTAKPDQVELASAIHHFIDSHSIFDDYSAGDFERDALQLCHTLFQKKDFVVAVGGSGLFVRALCEGFDPLPDVSKELRERLNLHAKELGITSFQETLKEIDPAFYRSQSIHNTQRVIRAIEIYESTGKPLSYFQNQNTAARPFNIVTIGLNMDRSILYDRINRRVDKMMDHGLLDEAKTLYQYKHISALQTVGYSELFDFIDGNSSLIEAVDKIKQNSRKYAKRQITWFKKYGNTHWFDPAETDKIIAHMANT